MNDEIKDAGTKPYGATANAMGDASTADLKDGVFDANAAPGAGKLQSRDEYAPRMSGGVCGRPNGWER